MSFKIVQTKEAGKKLPSLLIVPAAWEKEGKLLWPPKKKETIVKKHIFDSRSKPEEDWVPLPCIKKRQHFLSYEAAEIELKAMLGKSDSEDPEEQKLPLLTSKRLTLQKRLEIGRVEQSDFNYLAEECKKVTDVLFNKENQTLTEHVTTITPTKQFVLPLGYKIIAANNNINQPSDQDYEEINQDDGVLHTVHMVSQTVDDDQESPEHVYEQEDYNNPINDNENQVAVLEKLEKLGENQMRIMEQLSEQQTLLQIIFEQMSNNATTGLPEKGQKADSEDPFPIDSQEKLEKMELELTNEKYMAELITLKVQFCGSSGKLNGLNCCYHLVDQIFTRNFLTNFSWAGGSRNEEGKVAFKRYKNIMKLFFYIIQKADLQFSEKECEQFFKSIIKNAKRRCQLALNNSEKRRASSGKLRPMNLNYKKRKNMSEDENNEVWNENQVEDSMEISESKEENEGKIPEKKKSMNAPSEEENETDTL